MGTGSRAANREAPRVSVVIPAYNAEKYLGAALDSLAAQTYPADEIIVVDDGSTDGTAEIARAAGRRVTLIQQGNAGEGAARNRGLAAATGDYVAFLDADDVCSPVRLEHQLARLRHSPEAVACFTGHWTFDGSGRLTEQGAVERASQDPLDFLARCLYVGATVMFDRGRARGLRFPEERGVSGVDMIFSALLATRGGVVTVPEPVYGYRTHPMQISIGLRANEATNPFFEFRHQWASEHWREYWPERSWAEVERKLWNGLVQQTVDAYWARHKQYFLNDRNYMRRHWPSALPRPEVLRWRWYPDWLWRVKGVADRWVGPSAGGDGVASGAQ